MIVMVTECRQYYPQINHRSVIRTLTLQHRKPIGFQERSGVLIGLVAMQALIGYKQ